MLFSVQSLSCYKYSENARANTVFRGPYPITRQTITKDETGLIDLEEKNAKQSIKSVKLDGDGNDLCKQEIETILIKDKLYNKMDGKWAMSVVPDTTKSFNELNKLNGLVDLINSSNIQVVSIGIVDGERCYEVRVEPELNTIRSILIAQASAVQSSAPISLPVTSFEDLSESGPLLSSSDVSYTVWLTEDKCIPKKMDAKITFTLTPASMNSGSERMPNYRINATVKDTLVLSDFDTPGNIVLPGEVDNSMIYS